MRDYSGEKYQLANNDDMRASDIHATVAPSDLA